MSIDRFEPCCCSYLTEDGEFVRYVDYKDEVDALQAEILRLKSLLNNEYDDGK